MRSETITVRTGNSPVVKDITAEAARFVESEGDGLLHVFVPHATAGLAIIETGAGSDEDLLAPIDELLPAPDKMRHEPGAARAEELLAASDGLLPAQDKWRHRQGSRGHGRDHVLPAWFPPYASLP